MIHECDIFDEAPLQFVAEDGGKLHDGHILKRLATNRFHHCEDTRQTLAEKCVLLLEEEEEDKRFRELE